MKCNVCNKTLLESEVCGHVCNLAHYLFCEMERFRRWLRDNLDNDTWEEIPFPDGRDIVGYAIAVIEELQKDKKMLRDLQELSRTQMCDFSARMEMLKDSDCCLYSVEGLWTIEHMNVEKQLFAAIASGETLREVFDKAIAKDWKPVEGEDVFRGVEEDIIAENLRLKEENATLKSDLDDLRISNGVTMAHSRLLRDYEKLEKENMLLKDALENTKCSESIYREIGDNYVSEIKVLQREIIDCQRELIAEKDSHSLCRTELMDLRVSIRDKELANKPIVARLVVEELGKPAVERTEHHDYVIGMDYARDVIPPHTADDNSAGG